MNYLNLLMLLTAIHLSALGEPYPVTSDSQPDREFSGCPLNHLNCATRSMEVSIDNRVQGNFLDHYISSQASRSRWMPPTSTMTREEFYDQYFRFPTRTIFDAATQEILRIRSDGDSLRARIPTKSGQYDLARVNYDLSPGIWDISLSLPQEIQEQVKSSLAQEAPIDIYLDGKKLEFSPHEGRFVESSLGNIKSEAARLTYNQELFSRGTYCDGNSEKIWHKLGQIKISGHNTAGGHSLIQTNYHPKLAILDNGIPKEGVSGSILIDAIKARGYTQYSDLLMTLENPIDRPIGFSGNSASWRLKGLGGDPLLVAGDSYIKAKLRNTNQPLAIFDFSSQQNHATSYSRSISWDFAIAFNHGRGIAADNLVAGVPVEISWPGYDLPVSHLTIDQRNIQKSEECHPASHDVFRRIATISIPEDSLGHLEVVFSVNRDVKFRRKGRARGYVYLPRTVLISKNKDPQYLNNHAFHDFSELDVFGHEYLGSLTWNLETMAVDLSGKLPNRRDLNDIALRLINAAGETVFNKESLLEEVGDPQFYSNRWSKVGNLTQLGFKLGEFDLRQHPFQYPYLYFKFRGYGPVVENNKPLPGLYRTEVDLLNDFGVVLETLKYPARYLGAGHRCGSVIILKNAQDNIDSVKLPDSLCIREAESTQLGQSCATICRDLGGYVHPQWAEMLAIKNGAICKAHFNLDDNVPQGPAFGAVHTGWVEFADNRGCSVGTLRSAEPIAGLATRGYRDINFGNNGEFDENFSIPGGRNLCGCGF